MTDTHKRQANAEAQARHRVGTAHRLKAIEAKVDRLVDLVQQDVSTANMIRKAITQDPHHG